MIYKKLRCKLVGVGKTIDTLLGMVSQRSSKERRIVKRSQDTTNLKTNSRWTLQ